VKRLLLTLAAAGALTLGLLPATAHAAAQHNKIGTITGHHTGTMVLHHGGETFTLRFDSKGLVSGGTVTGGAHGMAPRKVTITKVRPPGHHYENCWDQWVCDDYGNCWYQMVCSK
jgi:hypothetical protein